MEMQSLVAKIDAAYVEKLISSVPADEIDVVKTPEMGLLMMAVKDSFDTEFYLGEILVTEAEVRYSGHKGYSMIIGDEPQRAIAGAVVDAIMSSDNDILKQRISRVLLSWEKKIEKREKQQAQLVAKTKVNFETMRKG